MEPLLSQTSFLLVMALGVTILGLSKGGFAGIGIVTTPLVALVTDPVTAAGLMLPIMIVQDLVAIYIYRQEFDAGILWRMIPGGALGVACAYLLASSVPEWAVKAVLGGVALLFAFWQSVTYVRGMPGLAPPAGGMDRGLGALAGAAGGFSSAIAHAGAPPFQIYVMPKHLRKESYVGAGVMFFASMNALKLPSFGALGLFSSENLRVSAVFLPLAVVASWAGSKLVRYIEPKSFTLIITLILFFVSIMLIGEAFHEALGG